MKEDVKLIDTPLDVGLKTTIMALDQEHFERTIARGGPDNRKKHHVGVLGSSFHHTMYFFVIELMNGFGFSWILSKKP